MEKTRTEPGFSRTIPDESRIFARENGTLQQWPTVLECLVPGSYDSHGRSDRGNLVSSEEVTYKSICFRRNQESRDRNRPGKSKLFRACPDLSGFFSGFCRVLAKIASPCLSEPRRRRSSPRRGTPLDPWAPSRGRGIPMDVVVAGSALPRGARGPGSVASKSLGNCSAPAKIGPTWIET